MATQAVYVNRERLLKTLLDLLAIDSPSGDEAGVARFVGSRLRALGLQTSMDSFGNVLARLAGEGEPFLLSAHMDNVPPCRGVKPVLEGDLLRSDGTTVLGADDKSGVAAILETLAVLQERGLRHPPLEIAFSVQEETGLTGARGLDMGWFRAREGIVVDQGGPIARMVTRAPSQNALEIVIHGRTAHAGAQPEKGINAIQVAAEAIARMPLGRLDAETTANIGLIEGGQARNIVPGRCRIVGETRSHSASKLDRQTDLMLTAVREAAERRGARADTSVVRSYEAYAVSADAPVARRLQEAGRAVGIDLQPVATGGGSDANVFNHHGLTCVILGTGYEDAHTTSERILIGDMVKSTEILVRAVTAGS